MTDFQYTDGMFLEEGQRWVFLYHRPIHVTICQLMPTRELVRVQTKGQRGTNMVTDLSWSTFVILYNDGEAHLKSPEINPEKVLPKFRFNK
jgi:hypothetical protein